MFGKKKKPTPQVGERWKLPDKPDPFGGKTYPPVRILEVREGWVRYQMGAAHTDDRQTIADFVGMYNRVEA